MWTKEPPKEIGYYWFRYPQMVPIYLEDNPTIVRLVKPFAIMPGAPLVCLFPGNDTGCSTDDPSLLVGDPEWWSERIAPPLHDSQFISKSEKQRAAGLRTVAKPGEPGYHEANLMERAEHD